MKINRGAREMRAELDTLPKLEKEILECGGTKALGKLYSVTSTTVSNWRNRLKIKERVEKRLMH